MHARGQRLGRVRPAADIGKEQQGMAVERPIGPQLLIEGRGQRQHPIPLALAAANPQLVFPAVNSVNRQAQHSLKRKPQT